MRQLVLATHNDGKIAEMKARLERFGFRVVGAKGLGIPAPAENGQSFEENAIIKAENDLITDGWSISDDSGLCVAALGGAPGVATADYGGWEKLLREMEGVTDREAFFHCTIALARPAQPTLCFTGTCRGWIAEVPEIFSGFGYDPVFIPEGYSSTFSALGIDEKNKVSHRSRALDALEAWLERHVSEGLPL